MSLPIYVQVNEQKKVLDTVDEIKDKLLAAKKVLHELYSLRIEENKQLELTRQKISNIDDRVSVVEEAFTYE